MPPLLFLTDSKRIADPEAVARRLPRGAGLVFRAFGATDAFEQAGRLKDIAQAGGLTLLIGADEALAMACDADGLHLPERSAGRAPGLRARHPDWLITVAAHSTIALRRAVGADAALLSAVFPSQSPTAGPPLGPVRFAAMTRAARVPVYALGGINMKTAPRLLASGAVGLAVVSAA